MKLTACPACGKSVSTAAVACPDCGQPIAGGPSSVVKFGRGFCLLVLVGCVAYAGVAWLRSADVGTSIIGAVFAAICYGVLQFKSVV